MNYVPLDVGKTLRGLEGRVGPPNTVGEFKSLDDNKYAWIEIRRAHTVKLENQS